MKEILRRIASMKRALFLAIPFAFVLMLSAQAEEAAAKPGEWTVSVGCAHCNFEKETGAPKCAAAAKTADGKVLLLTGAVSKDFKKGGDYVVKGKIAADAKSIEVSEMTKK